MTTNLFESKNPYRVGSKLHHIFHLLADGAPHTLVDITEAVYHPGAGYRPIFRRRVSSALRTIRNLYDFDVVFNGNEYVLYFYPPD